MKERMRKKERKENKSTNKRNRKETGKGFSEYQKKTLTTNAVSLK